MKITIKVKDQESGEDIILAEANLNSEAQEGDDGYYFPEEFVNKSALAARNEQGTCAAGECEYFDAIDPENGDVLRTEVAWLVTEAVPGLEEMNHMYGFPQSSENGVFVEVDGKTEDTLEEGEDTFIEDAL